jgi:uncharacterized membrane protein
MIEQLIHDKKRQKLAAEIGKERYSSNSSKRGCNIEIQCFLLILLITFINLSNYYYKSGKRKKDTPEEKRAKADARKKKEE